MNGRKQTERRQAKEKGERDAKQVRRVIAVVMVVCVRGGGACRSIQKRSMSSALVRNARKGLQVFKSSRQRRMSIKRECRICRGYLIKLSSQNAAPQRFLFFSLFTGAGARKYPPFGMLWPPPPPVAARDIGGTEPSGSMKPSSPRLTGTPM